MALLIIAGCLTLMGVLLLVAYELGAKHERTRLIRTITEISHPHPRAEIRQELLARNLARAGALEGRHSREHAYAGTD